ncbi:MAG: hypothetical protein ACOCXG_04945 [Nanoarchaeota archaeon]
MVFLVPGIMASVYNENGDFSVELEKQQAQVYNDNIEASFDIHLTNLLNERQEFEIVLPSVSGWDVDINADNFVLSGKEIKDLTLKLEANSQFDYGAEVISPDLIKYSQKTDYKGFFNFPVILKGEEEDVTLIFSVDIIPRDEQQVVFIPKFANLKASPQTPLQYTINAEDINEREDVMIKVIMSEETMEVFHDTFSPENSYKIYRQQIPVSIDPGTYDLKVLIRKENVEDKSSREWYETAKLQIEKYEEIVEIESVDSGIFSEKTTIKLENIGNVEAQYQKTIDSNFFKSLFFFTDDVYSKTNGDILINTTLEKGEVKTIEYSFNYVGLYLLLLIILLISVYIYKRKTSNPLAVDNSLYEVRRVEHEGVKSFKVRIGFENIKENLIDDLKIVFRMPAYLSVEDDSFLLVEPKSVLKGKNQYKLIWDFKKFEKEDSRILGFALVNKKGVLGDIRLPDLEVEVKVGGKHRRYFVPFPIIRG